VLSPAFETCLTAFYANLLEAFGDEQRRDGSP